ncbi:hypothetical protein KSS87_003414 [Heliosperma pusillum]|nr:hypothetical protein KSS87_003414 [Heliosperma pusillum]
MSSSPSTLKTKGESSCEKTTTSRNFKEPAIGIDLGTTNSCVGVWQHGRIEIITNDLGNRTTPSWVAFTQTHRHIGDAAKTQGPMNPTNTIFDTKRLIGRKFDDPIVQDEMKHWPFKVIVDPENPKENNPRIVVTYKNEEKLFSPEQISSMILVKMKEIAETYLGKEVKNAVVTVPAYFNNAQRKATKDAGVIAGLNVERIINEPTAAAIAYGLNKELTRYNAATKNILVFDLGGGTLDVSIVTVQKKSFEVKAVSGDTHLGGGDFDKRLVSYFVDMFARKYKKHLGENPRALGRLRAACERAKWNLSSSTTTSIEIDCLLDGIHFSSTISRARFEYLNEDLFKKCLEPVDKCLNDAKMNKTDVHDIVLVGGSTRIPMVQQLLQNHFNGKELCRSINPDEAVAYGAACHAAILAGVGDLKDTALVDVIPLSLGVDLYDNSMRVFVPRNTTIPTKRYGNLHTSYKNQNPVSFQVYEGEKFIAKENNFLGMFYLYNIPPGPERASTFDVCFEIDANGILTVSARLIGTNNMGQITVTEHGGRLRKELIDKMVVEGGFYKAQDAEYKRAFEAKTALEDYIEEVSEKVRQCRNRFEKKDKILVEKAIEQTLRWLDLNDLCVDTSMFERKKAELQTVCLRMF